jgi:hypothetical protein
MKKRYKTESLPQIRNRYEKTMKMSSMGRAVGGRNEMNDDREEKGDGSRAARYQKARKKETGTRHRNGCSTP